jgi:tetratricopeptide (TPR) repeat protein
MADLKAAMQAAKARRARETQQNEVFDPPPREDVAARASELRARGNALFASRDIAGAEAAYREALGLPGLSAPDRSLLLSNCALLAMQQGEWEKARLACDQAVEADPANVKAVYRRALASEQLGQIDAARADIDAVLSKLDPATPEGQQARALQERLPSVQITTAAVSAARANGAGAPLASRAFDFDVPAQAKAEGWGVLDEAPPQKEAPMTDPKFDSRSSINQGSDYFNIDTAASDGKFITPMPRPDFKLEVRPLPDFATMANEDDEFLENELNRAKSGRAIGAMPLLIDEDAVGETNAGAVPDPESEEETEEDRAAAQALLDFCLRKKEKDDRMAKWRERWGD